MSRFKSVAKSLAAGLPAAAAGGPAAAASATTGGGKESGIGGVGCPMAPPALQLLRQQPGRRARRGKRRCRA
jgi:hypothetical protein